MKKIILSLAVGLLMPALSHAEVITFDDHISGAPFYNFDADQNGQTDIIFSTTDPAGLNTGGPGPDQNFIQEPGLEGTVELTPDLRVDFLRGAVNSISFNYALLSEGPTVGGEFTVFDATGGEISSSFFYGDHSPLDNPGEPSDGFSQEPFEDGSSGETPIVGEIEEPGFAVSAFPEGEYSVDLGGATAAYATWDFGKAPETPTSPVDSNLPGRYILDNFTFDSAGDELINAFEGALPEEPLLPVALADDGIGFVIDGDITEGGLGNLFPIFIDPEIAVGYTYELTSDQFFSTVVIPDVLANGDDEFIITIDGIDYVIRVGETFDIAALGQFKRFTISGIDVNEELDPTDQTAFVTGLTFDGSGTFSVTQTPIIVNTTPPPPATVPEPSTVLMFGLGLLAVAGRRKSQK